MPVTSIQEKRDVVAEGKIIDFIDETLRNDTPEEYVRQQIERSIIKEYLYPKEDCDVEFTIKMGTFFTNIVISNISWDGLLFQQK